MSKLVPKIHAVTIDGKVHYAEGVTKQGAIRKVYEHLGSEATAEVASQDQLMEIGRHDLPIIGKSSQLDLDTPPPEA